MYVMNYELWGCKMLMVFYMYKIYLPNLHDQFGISEDQSSSIPDVTP